MDMVFRVWRRSRVAKDVSVFIRRSIERLCLGLLAQGSMVTGLACHIPYQAFMRMRRNGEDGESRFSSRLTVIDKFRCWPFQMARNGYGFERSPNAMIYSSTDVFARA